MVSGRAVAQKIDEYGNIQVQVEFTLTDGSTIMGNLHYDMLHFTQEKVLTDIKEHCEQLVRKAYVLKRNHEALTEVNVVGLSHNCDSAEIVIKNEKRDAAGGLVTPKKVLIATDK